MAEREGFEPPEPCGSSVFKTDAFDHSATSPRKWGIYGARREYQALPAILLQNIKQLVAANRFGNIVVHAGIQALLAVFLKRMSR